VTAPVTAPVTTPVTAPVTATTVVLSENAFTTGQATAVTMLFIVSLLSIAFYIVKKRNDTKIQIAHIQQGSVKRAGAY
jgi:hypothetical protein